MVRRAQFSHFISSNTSLTMNRYFRLMSLAMANVFITVPISTYGLYVNITFRPYYHWKSWSDTHSGWYIIDKYPAFLLRTKVSSIVTLELSRWSLVFCAVTFFAFFGLAGEARKQYGLIFSAFAKHFGFPSSSKGESGKSCNSDILPVFSPRKLDSSLISSTHTTNAWCTSPTDTSETVYSSSPLKEEDLSQSIHPPRSITLPSRSSRYTI